MEARPPAKNRHGGAPRGERPASWDAPRLTRADHVASRKRDNNISAPVGAPPTPLRVGCEWIETNPGATTRRGNEQHWLSDIVNAATANGSCARRDFARVVRPPTLVSRRSERQRANSRDPGATRQNRETIEIARRMSWVPGLASLARDTRLAPDFVRARQRPVFGETNPRCKCATPG